MLNFFFLDTIAWSVRSNRALLFSKRRPCRHLRPSLCQLLLQSILLCLLSVTLLCLLQLLLGALLPQLCLLQLLGALRDAIEAAFFDGFLFALDLGLLVFDCTEIALRLTRSVAQDVDLRYHLLGHTGKLTQLVILLQAVICRAAILADHVHALYIGCLAWLLELDMILASLRREMLTRLATWIIVALLVGLIDLLLLLDRLRTEPTAAFLLPCRHWCFHGWG